jgi:hypothetical protein
MRLTLRTLLAWLDDTLQPTQVTEIGRQVGESPFAQELSERIHRVTRQRRLTVPPSAGPEGTDPNVVASYLDNDLDPEAVAEYEKKCLTSDVNLAEVASVHQILSLLGQKVRVPPEARARMYQLVKGREATPPKRSKTPMLQPAEPVTKPIAPWVVPETPKNSWIERFGLMAACVLLIALAGWSATRSFTRKPAKSAHIISGPRPIPRNDQVAAAPADVQAGQPGSLPGNATSGPEAPEAANLHGSTGDTAASSATPGTETPKSSTSPAAVPAAGPAVASKDTNAARRLKESAVPSTVPAGASGVAESPDGILLRFDPERREWIRLLRTTPLAQLDRILDLAPFRAVITLDKARIALVGETEVRILSRPADKIPALELIQGRLIVQLPDSSALKVGPTGLAVSLEASQDSTIGLERVDRREYGQPVKATPPLGVYCLSGDVTLTVEQKNETLTASTIVVVDSTGQLKRTSQQTVPGWVTTAEPSPVELQLREQFVRLFHPGRPVLAEIVAATEDERAEMKKLSVGALKALGDLSLLMPLLSRKDDPVSRKSALGAIRAYMGLGPEAAGRVHDQLAQEFGDDLAVLVEKMLVGFTGEEASNPAMLQRMVEMLGPDQELIGLRELALDTLKHVTGRDDLGYNPDRPESKALNAWADLLRRGELRPLPRSAKPR